MRIRISIISITLLLITTSMLTATVQKIAVLDFEPQERAVRTTASQMLHPRRGDFTTLLDEHPQFELIDLKAANKAVSDLNLSSIRNISSSQAVEIGNSLEADIVIWGTVSDVSDTEVAVLANVMNVRSGTVNQLRFNLRKRTDDRQQGLKVELIDKISEMAGGEIDRLFSIGEQQLTARNYTGARDTFERIVNIDPQHLDAYFYLGYIKYMLNDYEMSEDYYLRALEIDPDNERVLNNLAETQRLGGKQEEAIATLRQLAGINDDEMIWFRIGNIYSDLNYLYEAIEALEKSLEINPEFERAHYRLGILHFDNNHYREAIPHLEFISEFNPEDDLINKRLTTAYLRTDQLDQAIIKYQNQIERDPQNTTAYLNLSGAYRTLERNQEALNTLNKLLEIEKDNPTVYIRLADAKLALNRLSEAENDANKAITLDQDMYESYMILSQIYQVRGYEEYEKFIRLEEEARGAYGSEADRLVSERDRAKNRANDLFTRANQYLDTASTKTAEPSINRDITSRKQLLNQLIEETKRTFFD